jgi:hypothetical protein
MNTFARPLLLVCLPAVLTVAACGGGALDATPGADPAQIDPSRVQALAAGQAAQVAAATATAQSSTNDCAAIKPFYWEIGNRDGRIASGSVNSPAVATHYSAGTPISIASASKWIYAAYVAERNAGVLSTSDRKYLSMRSGYVSLSACARGTTVDGCLSTRTNGQYTAADDGIFKYDGGHMEKHASLLGLGRMNNAALADEMKSRLGAELRIAYSQPQLAGGIVTSADTYAQFLRKLLDGRLRLGALLGSEPVCTNPLTCGRNKALYAPVPPDESWHYSVGHWIEDDAEVGDGAFSSPGAFGFYPWIDAGKATYGIVARSAPNGAFSSVRCGRLIRKAFSTGATF